MREVLGRINEGDGNCGSVVGGAEDTASVDAVEAADGFLLPKSLSRRSNPFAIVKTARINQVAQKILSVVSSQIPNGNAAEERVQFSDVPNIEY